MRARASSTRRRMPPESFEVRVSAFARRSKTSIISSARAVRVVARHAEVAAVVDERLVHGEEAVEVDVLLGEADVAARGERVRGPAEDERLALRDPDQVADRVDRRRLAGAVRARAGRRTRRPGSPGRSSRARACRRRSAWSGRGARGREASPVHRGKALAQPRRLPYWLLVVLAVLARADRLPPPVVVAVPVDRALEARRRSATCGSQPSALTLSDESE